MATISLAACGNNSNKKSAQERENSSLKAENSSLKAKKKAQDKSSSSSSQPQQDQNSTTASSSSSSHILPTNQEVISKVKASQGFNGSGYDTSCDYRGDGIFWVQVRQDAPDTPINGHTAFVGNFQYDANTDSVSQLN